MKKISWLAAVLFFIVPLGLQAQNGQFSFGYNMMLPQGSMKAGWSSAHGMAGDALFTLKKVPALSVGAEMSFSMYAYNEKSEDYFITPGTLATSDVSFSSYVVTFGAKAKLESPKKTAMKPYAAFQFGVLYMSSDLSFGDFYTSSYDYDCYADNTKTLVDDADWYAALGGGLKFDVSLKKKPGRNFIDFYGGYIGGGEIKYANMNRIHTVSAVPITDKDVIKVVFVNTITNETQEMQVAQVYRHPISMLQFQLKWTMAF
jgi:hypothetical protein